MDTISIDNRNEFINQNKSFIYTCASKICSRKLDWANDDELSVALIAFNGACDSYNSERGNFYSYAKVVIRNSLIDYFRSSKKNSYLIFKEEEVVLNINNKEAVNEFEKQRENNILAQELIMLSNELMLYKISINDLLKASPSHIDTRNTLLKVAYLCSCEDGIVEYIISKKNLPIKEIMLLTGSKRKYLEKWRKYILALILILSNKEYQYIKSFLNIKVGENYE